MNGTIQTGSWAGESFLLRHFRRFYTEVVRQKRLIVASPNAAQADAKEVHQRLLSMLERQALEAGHRGGEYGPLLYREVEYVMAVLADETFIHLAWSGSLFWRDHLLEEERFHTHEAGEQFFDNIEQLLNARDPSRADVAAVYLTALAMGFRGKFWGRDDHGRIESYRQQLYNLIQRHAPDLLGESKRLFPGAYSHTLTNVRPGFLPGVQKWLIIAAIVVASWLVGTYFVWHLGTDSIFEAAKFNTSNTLP